MAPATTTKRRECDCSDGWLRCVHFADNWIVVGQEHTTGKFIVAGGWEGVDEANWLLAYNTEAEAVASFEQAERELLEMPA